MVRHRQYYFRLRANAAAAEINLGSAAIDSVGHILGETSYIHIQYIYIQGRTCSTPKLPLIPRPLVSRPKSPFCLWKLILRGRRNARNRSPRLRLRISTAPRAVWRRDLRQPDIATTTALKVAGSGDFNHDGTFDVLFQNPISGAVAV
jgi:hypothetical protein